MPLASGVSYGADVLPTPRPAYLLPARSPEDLPEMAIGQGQELSQPQGSGAATMAAFTAQP